MSDEKTTLIGEIKKIINKFEIPNLDYYKLIKKLLIYVVFFILLFIFLDKINLLICNYISYFTVSNSYSNKIIILPYIAFVLIIILGYIKLIKYKYLASRFQFFSLLTFISITIHIYLNRNTVFELNYITDSFGIPLFIYSIILLVISFLLLLYNYLIGIYYKYKKFNSDDNFLLEDTTSRWKSEIYGSNLNKSVPALLKILKKDRFNKSFSIAITGSWGSGKSSLISLVKDEVEKEDDIILIDFKPFQNHNKNEIIEQFFDVFKDKLKKFNGNLSNKIVHYAQKLNEVYENKTIGTLLNNLLEDSSKSSDTLYKEVNSSIKKLNKKIVVIIDDLDRLSSIEILHVLKLIRSSANFYNTIFLVALDKKHVLNSINTNLLKTNYLDKFFQLEIFLPKIDVSEYRTFFEKEINKKGLEGLKIDFKELEKNNLFDEFITSFRDVLKLVNQIIFDHSLITVDNKEFEINENGFINFTIFKLKCPEFYEELKYNHVNYFELSDNNLYDIKSSFIEDEKFKFKPGSLFSNSSKIERIITNLFLDNIQNTSDSIRHKKIFNKLFSPSIDVFSKNEIKQYISSFKGDIESFFPHTDFDKKFIKDFLITISLQTKKGYTIVELESLFLLIIRLLIKESDQINFNIFFKAFDRLAEIISQNGIIEILNKLVKKDDGVYIEYELFFKILEHIDNTFLEEGAKIVFNTLNESITSKDLSFETREVLLTNKAHLSYERSKKYSSINIKSFSNFLLNELKELSPRHPLLFFINKKENSNSYNLKNKLIVEFFDIIDSSFRQYFSKYCSEHLKFITKNDLILLEKLNEIYKVDSTDNLLKTYYFPFEKLDNIFGLRDSEKTQNETQIIINHSSKVGNHDVFYHDFMKNNSITEDYFIKVFKDKYHNNSNYYLILNIQSIGLTKINTKRKGLEGFLPMIEILLNRFIIEGQTFNFDKKLNYGIFSLKKSLRQNYIKLGIVDDNLDLSFFDD